MTAADTRSAILDAAEHLFATAGYAATTLRQLTAQAGVNLAAVHYHFGSKEDLARALLLDRVAPINEERLRRLDELEQRPEIPNAQEILAAFVGPALERWERRAMCRMFGRMLAEQPPFLRQFLQEQFATLGARFVAALQRALPELAPAELWWRLHFTVGAMAHTLQHADDLLLLSGPACERLDGRALAERLIAFATGGTLASPTATIEAR